MARILTGIQGTGRPHMGNLLGALLPALALARDLRYEAFFFIADLHTLTTLKDTEQRKQYVYETAAAWLACGLDPKDVIFYRQSKVAMVCELAWFLNCFTPYPMLANAHAFKDKSHHLAHVNAGLFTYPVLMAADILLYQAELVPVGADQVQHLEITRHIAQHFNHQYGPTFVLPHAKVQARMSIPGTDGRKMSKSYNNTIDLFLPEKALKKSIMAIPTDSTPIAMPKNPDQCTVYKLYSALATADQAATMRQRYLQGDYGYRQAKEALFGIIVDQFASARQLFMEYSTDWATLDTILAAGEEKANAVATLTIQKVRHTLGL